MPMNKEPLVPDTNLKPSIEIEFLSDSTDCDQAGCSGGYSEGAVVKIGNEVVLNLQPVAGCFGGDSWDRDEVYRLLLDRLGYNLVVWY